MIQLTALAKSYGSQTLFTDVTWRINPGDRWGLVGPNGVGKTTLLRIVAGGERPDVGEIERPKGFRLGYLAQEVRRDGGSTVLADVCAAVPEAGALEEEMRWLEHEMEHASEHDVSRLAERYGEVTDRFHHLDGFSVEARAKEILSGLGFAADEVHRDVSELSGGWAMRVTLAGLLLSAPDLLLLDEPTNHLDLESLEWLEGFLATYSGAWVVVSHDRYFLNRMVDGIAEMASDGVHLYAGTYDEYVDEREARAELLAKQAAGQARRVAELERFVERFRAKATKARQAQSRVKMLERIDRIEGPKRKKRALKLKLPEPARSGRAVLTLNDVHKAWPLADPLPGGPAEHVVYDGLSVQFLRGEKVALVGVNGAGKSTLLKVLAGSTPIQGGERRLGHNVDLYHFAQHQSDALHPVNTVLQELRLSMPSAGETAVRTLLGTFLFSGDDVEKPVEVLSGGEKARVALAKMLTQPCNLLLLDEPTNHLDLESREVLEAALAAYKSTIVFVSHDRYFINAVATKVLEVRVGGEVVEYLGDYDYWQWKLAEDARIEADRVRTEKESGSVTRATRPRREPKQGLSKNALAKLRGAVSDLEGRIEKLEGRMGAIGALLADPEVFADSERTMKLLRERTKLEEKLEPLMEKWEAASQRLAKGEGTAP